MKFAFQISWLCVMPISILYTIAYFHSLEIILRAETVEQAQAGDKCDFSGTLIVVPDVSKLQMPGKLEGERSRLQ